MNHQRLLKISLATLALLVLAGVAFLALAARTPVPELTLRHLAKTVHGPVATFEKSFKPSRLVRRHANSSRTKISVLRHGKWADLTLTEINKSVSLTPGIVQSTPAGRRVASFGYTFEVKVPVCQKWKVTFEVVETRRIGPRFFPITISKTNTWTSADIPGWSEIRKSFNRTD